MASFKGYDRQEGQKRRQGLKKPRRHGIPGIEFLENRQLLTGSGSNVIPAPIWEPTDTNLLDAQNGPMANLGTEAVSVYKAFLDSSGNTSQLASEFPLVEFENGLVGLDVKSLGGDFNQFVTQLTDVGMQNLTVSSTYGLVDGFVPISALPTIAELPQTEAGTVQYYPVAYASSEYQGEAYNEAETAMFADAARTQFNVDGSGQTIGVLSTSVNQYDGGLSESYATGDLNPNNPVLVLQDDPDAPTDEGRAMLENIHDIAPGASLQFATAFINEVSFGNNIKALQKAGSNIIVDDVGYSDEPMFQPGIVAQAVETVTAEGVTYFSAAGNEGPDSGYLSTFRPASGNITGIGAGTYMNFDPTGNNIELPITTGIANAVITFQFDQPYQFQEPAGSPGMVTSQVNFYVINASTGAIVATGNANNVATQQPWQMVTVPDAGSYYVAVQVVSGPNPGHIEFAGFNDTNGAVTVSTTYGSAGGTSYPSTFGHAADADTIGVGATPWWAPPSSLGIGQNPLANEPFSSSGPALQVFNAAGVALTTPLSVLNPSITAPDGGNTSFFEPGFTLDTSNPPFPGEPASSTNLVPTSQLALPVFFGTSSAAPNAAAVAALMLDVVPGLTPAEIRAGMETSAVPMNGQTQGTWIAADGYGFLNAIDAINAVNLLRVNSTTPTNGSTVTVTPSAITVTFNKPVNFSTVSAGDLTFLTAPSGVTVNVGTPIAVDNSVFPTIIQFPISFSKPTGTLANGAYSFSIQSVSTANPVESEDGKDLVPSGTIAFTLADTTSPVITGTTISGRLVAIKFSKAIDPSTVTLSNFFVLRQGSATAWPPTPATVGDYTNLNNDPRATISYDPTTFTVTLDYSALPQTELPSDKYAIVVLSPSTTSGGVTDLVGNPLFGAFSGVFPTGTGETTPQDFIQNLGAQILTAPSITTFVMTPTASNDTGIVGDQNTKITNPSFIGQIYAAFPGTVAGLPVYVEFASLHGGTTTLAVGGGGYGYQGTYDEVVTTTATGSFTVTPTAPLLQGFQNVVAVVAGDSAQPSVLPGLASSYTDAFRIVLTSPQITSASFIEGGASLPLPNGPAPNITPIPALTTLTLNVVDPVTQALPTLVTPSTVVFDALNPATAQNISNYSLINTSENDEDESQYIATATFVTTSPTLNAGTNNYVLAYNGYVNLTFLPGLPAGVYTFVAHTTELQYPGLTDAAANPLDDTSVPGEGTNDFLINFDIQPQPVYITSMALESSYAGDGSTVIGTEQSYFELPPANGTNTRDNVPAPPTAVVVDFSNPLPFAAQAANGSLVPIDYANLVQLIRSANTANGSSDGDFGNLGEGGLGSTGSGFTVLNNYTVSLYNYNVVTQTWSLVTTPGQSGTRLVLQLDPGSTLAADDYRVYIPNQVNTVGNNTVDSRIFDIYGNQLDGENLGNATSQASPDFSNPNAPVAIPNYEDLQSNGTYRLDDMSGDGVAGGAFMAAFTVVNYGNVVFARPDYVENPLVPTTLSTGTLANPFPVLAAEGDPNSALAANPNHNPLLGLNNPDFFNPGALSSPNPYDFSGDGKYEQSALYAAAMLTYAQPGNTNGLPPQLGGPVIVVAEPGIPQRNPVTGQITQAAFVLQAPAGNNGGVTNGSASVPFNTTLVFAAGSTLKLQNANLYVQNQGSALQTDGTASDPVNFTSYNDATIGGATNNNPDTNPYAGDWGGIVFRNYDQATTPSVTFPVDGTLVGLNGTDAISGEQDAMSVLNYANIRYAGGAVPEGSSNFFSAVTLYNSRPAITNTTIADTGGTGGTEAAIAADFDSFREDDTARGPLIRQVSVTDNSLNGLWLISESNGYIEPTDAMTYPDNPATLGGINQNYTFFEPLPFIVLAQLVVGQEFEVNTGGQTEWITNRLYIQPGVMMKFNLGSALDVLNPGASLNVGSRSYINGFDANNQYSPDSPNFVDESASDPQVLFTSLFDDLATTTLVPTPINVTGETPAESAAKLVPGAWGSVGIQSGAIAVINAATFQYGGGAINTPQFTMLSQSVLAFITAQTYFTTGPDDSGFANIEGLSALGTHAYITNNNFYHNFDAAMQIEPNGLLAGNPLTPLAPVDFTDPYNINNIGGGHPFFRGNVMSGNGIDGMAVITDRGYYVSPTNNYQFIGPRELIAAYAGYVNQTVNAVWDETDLTYVLRGTVVVAGAYDFENFNSTTGFGFDTPTPNLTTYTEETPPVVSLTIQSALPGTLLADGTTIPSPGQSVIIKLLNDETPNDSGPASLTNTYGSSGGPSAIQNAGAGWVVGVDDGLDPPAANEPLVDPGAYSEIRILGIPGNQTTGQQRVPVIITSLRDDTVGTTVRGVVMDDIANSIPLYTGFINPGASLTTPEAGDGGYIYVGGNSLTEYDPTDPFDGSIISNADISYMTRIEVQGGGIVDAVNKTGKPASPSQTNIDWTNTLTGYLAPVNQINAAMMFTIADSNLSDFSDAAVFVHPTALNALYVDYTGITNPAEAPLPARAGLVGEPVDLYMYNDTISNSNQGVHINSTTGDDSTGNTFYQAVLLNNTFYNDGTAIETIQPQFDGLNSNASVVMLIMNNIIDGSSQVGINLIGQDEGTQIQYNVFFANTQNILQNSNTGVSANVGATYGNPEFVGPVGSGNAGAQNFELEPTSPAINASRSEMGPNFAGNSIYPTITFQNTFNGTGGTLLAYRTNPSLLTGQEEPGRDLGVAAYASFGLIGGVYEAEITDPSQIVTLPGSGFFDFPDEWQPVLTTDPTGYSVPFQADGTYNYAPISGQRDVLGYIRAPQPGSTGTGYGSNPFIDAGAYQYVNLHPPEVTGVTETPTQGAAPVNFYATGAGNTAGVNQTPWTINISFNGPISPGTINANTVSLVDLGSNPAQPLHQEINLAGKLSYVSSTDTLVINLAAAGLTLGTDAYQITLFGSGSPVITNLQGVALSGTNTVGGTSTGAQLPLPSGNGYPGGNFFDSFVINTTPPSVEAGSLEMSPASDTNIVGDNITMTTQPTFIGTISEPNPALAPLAGQTAYLDIGIEYNGTTYFNTADLPASLAGLAQFIRPDAGTATSTTGGAFSITVGVDGANTGLVTNTTPLPNLFGTYNVGASGDLSPLPGTVSGYYVARVRIIDQSGNESNPADPNAQVPFVVDNTPPTVTVTSPMAGQVITSLTDGVINFTITTSKNIDMTHFNANSIDLINAGPDGILGTADDVTIPIDPNSIKVTYLDAVIGGPGAEQITFSTLAGTTLTNNLYQLTLLNTGPDAIRDIAGNVLAQPVVQTFAVFVPSLAQNLFVEEGADAATATGSREDPYATIEAAMTAAAAGDVIAVLPGVYQEQVTMKNFVKLYSAASTSTDSTVFTTSTGDALSTIIRAPFEAAPTQVPYATITASGLQSFAGLTTEIAGFTIASPLTENAASGPINVSSVAVDITSSSITLDKNYVIDAGTGVDVTTSGSGALTPRIVNDCFIGNIDGVIVDDAGSTPSTTPPIQMLNNDFAFNTVGLYLENSTTSPVQADVYSNIFWENHDQSLARNGYAIYSENPNKVSLRNNLFYGNGAGESDQSNATNDLGNGFSPALLGPTQADAQANLGNFVGEPAFVFPIDPRPGSDGPANFYIDADFQIKANSAAIDNAYEADTVFTDFLGNTQVYVNGGLMLPGFGPRDIGAFEYNGTGGQAIGGSFRVVTTSLVPIGGEMLAGGAVDTVPSSPAEITVDFSGDVNSASVSLTDLVLSGSAINPAAPVHVTSLTWIDAHTVEFNLTGQFVSSGTLDISIPGNSIESVTGSPIAAYSDSVVLNISPVTPTPNPTSTPPPTSPPTPTPTATPTPTPVASPPPASTPVSVPKGPLHKAKKVVQHAKKVVKHIVASKPKPVVHQAEPKKKK